MIDEGLPLTKKDEDVIKEFHDQPLQFEEDHLKQRTLALEIAGRLPHHTMAEVLQAADKAYEWIISKRYSTIF